VPVLKYQITPLESINLVEDSFLQVELDQPVILQLSSFQSKSSTFSSSQILSDISQLHLQTIIDASESPPNIHFELSDTVKDWLASGLFEGKSEDSLHRRDDILLDIIQSVAPLRTSERNRVSHSTIGGTHVDAYLAQSARHPPQVLCEEKASSSELQAAMQDLKDKFVYIPHFNLTPVFGIAIAGDVVQFGVYTPDLHWCFPSGCWFDLNQIGDRIQCVNLSVVDFDQSSSRLGHSFLIDIFVFFSSSRHADVSSSPSTLGVLFCTPFASNSYPRCRLLLARPRPLPFERSPFLSQVSRRSIYGLPRRILRV
jgi:hypothetical protein